MLSDLMLPVLVCAGCLVIIAFTYLKTRTKSERKAFSIPNSQSIKPIRNEDSEPLDPDLDSAVLGQGLLPWHELFESAVLDFIEFSDHLVGTIDSGGSLEEMKRVDVLEASETLEFQRAASEHPSPEMGAELSALLAAVSASLHAYLRGDTDLAKQQQSVYSEYREMWFQRLRQFPQDIDRIIRLRRA